MADTMISLNNSRNVALTEADIRKTCPYAFVTTPTNPGVSDKYVQATTIDVVRDMEKLGWYPVQAKQCRHKKNSSGIRSFHMIAFENENVKIMRGDNTEAYVRVILTNSHDGFSSFKFMLGCYRLVCSNGLVLADAEFANLTIRHINYDFEELKNTITAMLNQIPNVVAKMNRMNSILLSDEEKKEIAVEAYKIRKGYNEDNKVNIDESTIQGILEPLRTEDEGNTLWRVFNTVQEKIIKGGFYAKAENGKVRKQRAVKSIKKDIEYNTRLWAFAERYMAAA